MSRVGTYSACGMPALPPCNGPDGRAIPEALAVYRPLIRHHARLTLIVASVYQGQRA
jgi:hypothetical protein